MKELNSKINFQKEREPLGKKRGEKLIILSARDWESEKKLCKSRRIKDLPFIQSLPISKNSKKRKVSYWAVKPSGNTKKDFITGAQYGVLTQEYLIANGNSFSKNLFEKIIYSMVLKKENAPSPIELGFLWFFENLAITAGWGGIAELKGKIKKMETN